MQYTVFLLLAPISVAIAVAVLAYASRRETTPETSSLFVLMVAVSGWLIFNTLELISATPAATLLWAKLTYLFIVITPVAWLTFAFQYAGIRTWSRLSVFWLSAVIPLVTLLLLWIGPYEYLLWRSYDFLSVNGLLAMHVVHGPWFYVYLVNAYAVVMIGATVIVVNHFRSQQFYRRQSRWLLLGGLIPVFVNLIYVFNVVPGLRKDFTPIGFAISGLTFALGIFRYRLFDLQPIARTALVESMRDCVMTVDERNQVVDMNPAALALFTRLGLADSGRNHFGTPLLEFVAGWVELAQYLSCGDAQDSDLVAVYDGEQHYFACSTTALTSGRQCRIGRLIVLRDITDRKLAETALRQQMQQLQISNDQLDAFSYMVAHDLKGPLSNMTGAVELLQFFLDRMTKDEIQQHLESLNAAGRQMAGIIDSLLLLAQVHRQKELLFDILNMETVVVEALQRADGLISESGADISLPESWPDVVGYAPWIAEVLSNYLVNALKYGGTPPRITVGYEPCEFVVPAEAGGAPYSMPMMRFWIRDNGQGLTQDQIAELFTPFTRFHTGTVEGHGLGLAIVRRIIDRLGGQVGVESQIGAGCTFWFTLPTELRADHYSRMDAVTWKGKTGQ